MKKLFFEENENQIINSIYDNFKKEPKIPSVITEEKTEVLTEGLKFFKVSKRLYKLSDKIVKKARRKNQPEAIETAKKITKLAKKFEDAEDLYEVGNKVQARIKYKALIKDYSELIKLLRKSETSTALKGAGIFAVTIASMVVPYILLNKMFPALAFGAVNTEALGKPVLDQIGLYLKRAGAFTLCRIPTRAAGAIVNNGITTYDDKITDSVDNLLK